MLSQIDEVKTGHPFAHACDGTDDPATSCLESEIGSMLGCQLPKRW